MNNYGIGNRIKEVIQYLGMNMNSFSTSIGLPNNSAIVRIVNDPERGESFSRDHKSGRFIKTFGRDMIVGFDIPDIVIVCYGNLQGDLSIGAFFLTADRWSETWHRK